MPGISNWLRDQLALSMPMLDTLTAQSDCFTENGIDCRNYGELPGIPEARKLFGDYLGIQPEEVIVVGSASLTFMYDCMNVPPSSIPCLSIRFPIIV